jgi:hypothetical protein
MNLRDLQLIADKGVILNRMQTVRGYLYTGWLIHQLRHKEVINLIKTLYPENTPLLEEDYKAILKAIEILQ